jgi:hypothetical protein
MLNTPRAELSQESVAGVNKRPSERVIEARKAEIARRYTWNGLRRTRRPAYRAFDNVRMREIERFLHFKYPYALPDDDAGIDDLLVAAYHIAKIAERPYEAVQSWARLWAPWCSPEAVTAIVDRVFDEPMVWTADKLAWRLGLTDAVRTRLKIRTIGAIDFGAAERAKRAKAKDRQRKATERRTKGATPRKKTDAHTKPWELLKMSRATWYRKGRPTPPSRLRETLETETSEIDERDCSGLSVNKPQMPNTARAVASADAALGRSSDNMISTPRRQESGAHMSDAITRLRNSFLANRGNYYV